MANTTGPFMVLLPTLCLADSPWLLVSRFDREKYVEETPLGPERDSERAATQGLLAVSKTGDRLVDDG